jgi:hypothetical protein
MVHFLRPRHGLTSALIRQINGRKCDALVIRTGIAHPDIREIKKVCPDTTICLELNALFFEELFPDFPLRSIFEKWEVMRYNQADAIMVVSSYLKTLLEKYGVRREKILVNQNGVNVKAIDPDGVDDVRDQYDIPGDAFVIGYIGGMETFRRFPEVIGYMIFIFLLSVMEMICRRFRLQSKTKAKFLETRLNWQVGRHILRCRNFLLPLTLRFSRLPMRIAAL